MLAARATSPTYTAATTTLNAPYKRALETAISICSNFPRRTATRIAPAKIATAATWNHVAARGQARSGTVTKQDEQGDAG